MHQYKIPNTDTTKIFGFVSSEFKLLETDICNAMRQVKLVCWMKMVDGVLVGGMWGLCKMSKREWNGKKGGVAQILKRHGVFFVKEYVP